MHPELARHVLNKATTWPTDPVALLTWTLTFCLGLMLVGLTGPQFVWRIRHPFFFLNRLQWFLYNPLRWVFRSRNSSWTHGVFISLLCTAIVPAYWLAVHILLTPVRLVNACYFNMLLFWTLTISDGLKEIVNPKLGGLRTMQGFRYLRFWLTGFPLRLYHFIRRNLLMVVEGVVMTGFDLLWPTLTMWHGTSFQGTATDIAQRGRWYVGSRSHVGSGIYFGIERRVAEHYARTVEEHDRAIVVSRVTLSFCRTTWSLPPRLHELIGTSGKELSASLSWPWRSTEHWRDDPGLKWFEYCLVQPNRTGEYVRVWRARPVAVLQHDRISRIWGGFSLRSENPVGSLLIIITWIAAALTTAYWDSVSALVGGPLSMLVESPLWTPSPV